jgi:hypothetical protein
MQVKNASLLFAAALVFFFATAGGPTALETKQLAEHCDSIYGFNTPESFVCKNGDDDQLAATNPSAPSGPMTTSLMYVPSKLSR